MKAEEAWKIWNKLSHKQQVEKTNELWSFLYGHPVEGELEFTAVHLIALFENQQGKLKDISDVILTDLWQELEDIGIALEQLKKSKLAKVCEKIKDEIDSAIEDETIPDMRD